jgi:hypothetical protein
MGCDLLGYECLRQTATRRDKESQLNHVFLSVLRPASDQDSGNGVRNEAAPVEQLALSTFHALLGNAKNATDGGPKTWSSGCCGGPTLSSLRGGRLGERPATR